MAGAPSCGARQSPGGPARTILSAPPSPSRHGRRPLATYMVGPPTALGAWSLPRYVPDKPMALLLLGVTPFMARLMPANIKPDPDKLWQGTVYGTICMGLMLMTGVSGPLLDTFFL